MSQSKKVGFWNYVAYGAGDLYGGGAFFIVTTFAMYYFVNVVGMHPVLAGLIPAIGKIWDAISDPMMGYISDHTPQNRFGKRRVWFLVSIVPIAVSFALIWFPTSIVTQAGKFAFYTFAYIFFFTVATISYVPYAALSAEMTRDSKERNFLNGTRILFSFISTLLAGVIAKPVIGLFADEKTGYFVMGIIFSLIFALPWITLYLGTWELPELQRQAKKKRSFFANFFSLFRNRSCRIHILMYVGSYGTLDILMSWFMFYLVDYLNREAWFVIAQGALLLTMIGMLPVYVKIANKKGHAVAYLIGLSLFVAGMIFMSFQTPQTPVGFLIANVILLGSGISAGCLIPHALLPFVADIDRLISGEERAGTYSAAMTLTRKLFLGLIIMTGLGVLLAQIGYRNPVPYELPEIQYSEVFTEIQNRTNAVDTAYVFDEAAQTYRLDVHHKNAAVAEEVGSRNDGFHLGIGLQHSHGIADEARLNLVVGIERQQIGAMGMEYRLIAGTADSAVGLRNHPHALVSRLVATGHRQRVIGRTVVHDDNLKGGIVRRQHGIERFSQIKAGVIGRNDDRD